MALFAVEDGGGKRVEPAPRRALNGPLAGWDLTAAAKKLANARVYAAHVLLGFTVARVAETFDVPLRTVERHLAWLKGLRSEGCDNAPWDDTYRDAGDD
jgi:hypothetical protein